MGNLGDVHEQPTFVAPGLVRRRANFAVHEIDDDALIYDPTTASTHRLNSTAYFIWQQCDGRRAAGDIAQRVADAYEVPFEAAIAHVRRLLGELTSQELVTIAD